MKIGYEKCELCNRSYPNRQITKWIGIITIQIISGKKVVLIPSLCNQCYGAVDGNKFCMAKMVCFSSSEVNKLGRK